MQKVLRLGLGATIIGLSLASVGCGSGSGLTSTSSLSHSQVVARAPLTGRFFLGINVPNAQVQILSTSGVLLAETTTRADGSFIVPQFQGTADFRVTVRLNSEYVFAAEVRDYRGEARYVVVNVPTSLVSGYLQRNQGLSLAEAEARVADALQIPVLNLRYGIEESVRAPFSHVAFFQAAIEAGGWPAFRDQLLNQVNGTAPPPLSFRLTRQNARKSLAGLEPSLFNLLTAYLSSPNMRHQLASGAAHPMPHISRILNEGASNFGSLPAGSISIRAKVLSSITETLVGGAKEQLIDVGWTHIADALNLNYGTTRMLEVIQDQLIEVLSLLVDLNTKVTEYNLQQANNSLNPAVATIKTLTSNLANIDGGSDGVGGTPTPNSGQTSGTELDSPGTPYTPGNDVTSLTVSLTGFAALDALTQIEAEMLGTGGTTNVLTANRDQINAELGLVVSDSLTGNCPMRSNVIIEEMLTSHDYYAGLQQMACTILGETAHVSALNPAAGMNAAASNITGAVDSLKQQRGQLPQYLDSEKIVVDLQGGLMWYSEAQAPTSFEAANVTADNFVLSVGERVYDDWRLPSTSECDLLQDRGRLCSHRDSSAPKDGHDDSYGNTGYTLQGLPGLGFEPESIRRIDSDGDIWAIEWNLGTAPINSGQWQHFTGTYGLNHEHTPFGSAVHDHSFLMVRNIGEPVIIEDQHNQSYNKNNSYPYDWTPIRPDEFVTLGYVTGLGQGKISGAQAGATVTYSLNTGGNFSMGNSDSSDNRSLLLRSYTQQVDTYHGGNYDYAGSHNLYEIVRFQTKAGAAVSIGAEGALYWHNQQPTVNLSAPFTVAVLNMAGQTISGSGDLVPENAPVRSLQSIQMFPRNRKYDMTSSASASELYACLAYFSDNTIEDVTQDATWSVATSTGGSPAAAHFSATQHNELLLSNLATETLVITVSYKGKTDSCSALIYNN